MLTQTICLKHNAPTRMIGMRQSALPLRERIEETILQGGAVSLDFSDVEATQSFVDELVGVIVAVHGPSVLQNIIFKGCSPTVKGILQFVVEDRAADFVGRAH